MTESTEDPDKYTLELKNEGNTYFKEKNYNKAVLSYRFAINMGNIHDKTLELTIMSNLA